MSHTHQWQKNSFYCGLIVVISIICFFNSLHSPFIFDDEIFIVRNYYIHSLWNFDYYPQRAVGQWTFALNYALGGLNVFGYHVLSVLIHAACGLLVWWFTCLILSTPRLKNVSLHLPKEQFAFWIAILFVIHPIQTMAVNHITQRFVMLAALFYISGLSFYIKGRLATGKKVWLWFLAAAVAVFLGVFSRQSFISFPLVLLFCEFFLFHDREGKFRKKAMLIMGAIFLVSLLIYHQDVMRIFFKKHHSQSHLGDIILWYNYFFTQFKVILIYLKLLFVPIGLNFDYDIVLYQNPWHAQIALGFGVVVSLLVFAYKVRKRWPLLSFGVFWFFLTMVVESSILPIAYVIAEYRLYLPLFGFCLALIWGLQHMIKDRKILSFLLCIIVLAGVFLTIQRNKVYQSEIALWQDVIQKSPNKVGAYTNLGAAYLKQGEYPKALETLNQAVTLGGSKDYKTLYDLAHTHVLMGREAEGIEIYEKLLKIQATPWVYNNLGIIYERKGDLDKAKEYLLKADYKSRFYPEIQLNMARILWRTGEIEKAVKIYSKVIAQYPLENGARYSLVQLYLEQKDFDKAQIVATQILNSAHNDPQQLIAIGSAFAETGNLVVAMDLFDKVLTLDKKNPEAYLQAGKIMGNINKLDEAIQIWQMGEQHCPTDSRFKALIEQAQVLKAKTAGISL